MSSSAKAKNSIKLLVTIFALSLIVNVNASYHDLIMDSVPSIYLPIVNREYCSGDGDSSYDCATGPLISGELYTAYPNDINDYYYIDLYINGDITVTMNNYVGDGQLILRDANDINNAIDYHSTGGTAQMVNGSNLEVGRYLIQVHTADNWSIAQLYTLTATFPIPSIVITYPQSVVECQNDPSDSFCQFEIKGISSAVTPLNGLRIYVFVYPIAPPGAGWYLQKPRAIIESNYNWSQTPSYLGNDDFPATNGDQLRIRAAVVQADAKYNGTLLEDLLSSSVVNIEEIQGLIALSDTVELTVVR